MLTVPTRSIAELIKFPTISSLLAEIVATCRISSFVVTSREIRFNSATIALTACKESHPSILQEKCLKIEKKNDFIFFII